MEGVLTRVQYETAYRLALAYGHEWAMVAQAEGWSPCFYDTEEGDRYFAEPRKGDLCAVEEIRLHTLAFRKANDVRTPEGVLAPKLNGGVTHHTTGTGRLSWEVYPIDMVLVQVHRPAGTVAEVRRTDGRWTVRRLSPAVPFYQRHADTLMWALEALDAPQEIIRGVLGWVTEEPPSPAHTP